MYILRDENVLPFGWKAHSPISSDSTAWWKYWLFLMAIIWVKKNKKYSVHSSNFHWQYHFKALHINLITYSRPAKSIAISSVQVPEDWEVFMWNVPSWIIMITDAVYNSWVSWFEGSNSTPSSGWELKIERSTEATGHWEWCKIPATVYLSSTKASNFNWKRFSQRYWAPHMSLVFSSNSHFFDEVRKKSVVLDEVWGPFPYIAHHISEIQSP